jgi:hypothetical protein
LTREAMAMDCQAAQDAILRSDDPATSGFGDSELARHVSACAACQQMIEQLERIERVAATLLVTPGVEAARDGVIAQGFESQRAADAGEDPAAEAASPAGRSRSRWFLGPRSIAAAAVLLLGVGLTFWLWGQRNVGGVDGDAEVAVVEQLIDWNLAVADASAPQDRQRIYDSTAPRMQQVVQRARMSDADRRTARRLLENGAYLSRHDDPGDRAEKFCDLSDVLVGRMDVAAAADDARAVGRLEPRFKQVQRGLGADLQRLHATKATVPANEKRLERLQKRQAEAERRLAAAAEKHKGKASMQALRRALEAARKQVRQAERRTDVN